MNGTEIIGALLRAHTPLLTVVPAEWIKAGALSEKPVLPALLLRTVSLVDRQPLKRGPMLRSTARVGVMVRAASYREQVAVVKLVRAACAGFVGDLAGAERISVLTAGLGPDLRGPGNSFEQTQDFRVSFDAQP